MKRSFERILLGRKGEGLASKYLRKNGFRIIEANFSCHLGEIDLIAREKSELVFIEVRSLKSTIFDPLDSITARKQAKLKKLAEFYTAKNDLEIDIRFDVIGINFTDNGHKITHIKNAFL